MGKLGDVGIRVSRHFNSFTVRLLEHETITTV